MNARINLCKLLDGLSDTVGSVCGNITSAPVCGPRCTELASHSKIAILALFNSEQIRHTFVLQSARTYFQPFDLFRVVGQALFSQLAPVYAFKDVTKASKSTSDAISLLLSQSAVDAGIHFCKFQVKLRGLFEAISSRDPFESILAQLAEASNIGITSTSAARRDSYSPTDTYILHLRAFSEAIVDQSAMVAVDIILTTTVSNIDKWPLFRQALQDAGHFGT